MISYGTAKDELVSPLFLLGKHWALEKSRKNVYQLRLTFHEHSFLQKKKTINDSGVLYTVERISLLSVYYDGNSTGKGRSLLYVIWIVILKMKQANSKNQHLLQISLVDFQHFEVNNFACDSKEFQGLH